MFERSEFLRLPPVPSNAACPERSGGSTNPARLLFGDFLLAKQEKVTALPGAHPGKATTASPQPAKENQASLQSPKPRKPRRNKNMAIYD